MPVRYFLGKTLKANIQKTFPLSGDITQQLKPRQVHNGMKKSDATLGVCRQLCHAIYAHVRGAWRRHVCCHALCS